MERETVKIFDLKRPGDYRLIDAQDFNAERDIPFDPALSSEDVEKLAEELKQRAAARQKRGQR